MNQHQNIPVLPQTQPARYQISFVADTTVNKEEEEDPSDGESDYVHYEDALLSDLSIGKSSTYISPLTTDIDGAYNHSNLITPMRLLGGTIRSQPSRNQSSTQLSIACSAFLGYSYLDSLEAALMNGSKGNDTKMAETKDLERSEESHENNGAAKPDKDDHDGQDYKKQRFAEPYSMSCPSHHFVHGWILA